jgi:hypothetical protein
MHEHGSIVLRYRSCSLVGLVEDHREHDGPGCDSHALFATESVRTLLKERQQVGLSVVLHRAHPSVVARLANDLETSAPVIAAFHGQRSALSPM